MQKVKKSKYLLTHSLKTKSHQDKKSNSWLFCQRNEKIPNKLFAFFGLLRAKTNEIKRSIHSLDDE